MSRYVLSRRARRDLQDIWLYTARRWTVARADGYLADIVDVLVELAAGLQHSLPAEESHRGYRRSLVGSHVVFIESAPRMRCSSFVSCIRAWTRAGISGRAARKVRRWAKPIGI
jgi:toxin ParE1/3/4